MGRVKDLHDDLLREAIERMDAEMEAGDESLPPAMERPRVGAEPMVAGPASQL